MADYIDRDNAINDLEGRDPSQIWDTADIEVWVNELPSADVRELPDRERMDNIFIDIRNLTGYGGDNMQTIYMDNYIKQVYELIYGKGEKPWWMKD